MMSHPLFKISKKALVARLCDRSLSMAFQFHYDDNINLQKKTVNPVAVKWFQLVTHGARWCQFCPKRIIILSFFFNTGACICWCHLLL